LTSHPTPHPTPHPTLHSISHLTSHLTPHSTLKETTVRRNVEGERSLVYCERRNTRETEVAGVEIEPLTKGKIKWGRVLTLPAVLLVVAN
jgi:hypothetical protein